MSKSQLHLWQVCGPVAIVLDLVFAHHARVFLDLFLIGAAAPICIVQLRRHGLYGSVTLLALSSSMIHFWGNPHHLWRFSIELSLALSFLITFLAVEMEREWEEAALADVCAQETAQETRRRHLEEEFATFREESAASLLAAIAKSERYAAGLEEMEGEKNVIAILNDVLRKNQAASFEREEKLHKEVVEKEQRIEYLNEHAATLVDRQNGEMSEWMDLFAEYYCRNVEERAVDEKEVACMQTLIAHLFHELSLPHRSMHLREAFSSNKRSQNFPSLEETLRESLTTKKKRIK